ncbi:hypothetical protein [Deinococcus sp. JMULE3]|uniref:hypothetical protein n=1 Tax=Deinococcus sp. JMULE3 TaxID=2518341 RepID=UPI0015762E49|nr:hypothetical protein [Deinococcus sp. JMULE3]NTY02091.1 hypothetical protein [Deinococcus sp. JMULE3]
MPMLYQNYPTGVGSLAAYAQKLHELLTAAGWEIQHANANAIGTGTATNPKWDTVTPAANISAGIVTYRMPLAGLTNRWVIQVELLWGSPTAVINVRTTTALGVNAGTGALTTPGTTYGTGTNVAQTAIESALTVSEYGFAMVSTGNTWHGIERRRTITNAWADDILTHQHATGTPVGFPAGGHCRARSWATGEYAVMPLAWLHGLNSSSALDVTTLSGADNVGYPTGPYQTSDGLGGLLRHLITMRPADSVAGVDQGIEVQGATRMYAPLAQSTLTGNPGGNRILMAKG